MKAETTEAGRFYTTPSGLSYPSVTTVTGLLSKDAIKKWRARVGEEEANKISSRAAGRGTRMHTLCEDFLNNEPVSMKDPLSFDMFKSVAPILEAKINNVHAQEIPLYSEYLKVAGRVDCIAEYDGKLSVIDFKTASKPKKREWISGYFMQASAYAVMYEELTGIPVPRIVIVIAVEFDEPQVFQEKRDDHIHGFIRLRKSFQEIYGH